MKRISLTVCLTAWLAAPAMGADGDGEQFMPPTVTLSAASGDFRKWEKDLPCSAGIYDTTISLSDLHPATPWESAAQIIL
ncbi:MAG TPA: hypothetical protein VKB94_05665, partial [Rhizomicrobium sp.]|nr:hypothetical protein [Rhizomicrobium sp.]